MTEIKIDRQFIADCFRDFVSVPSPVSYYDEILPVLEKYAGMFGYPVTYDRKNTGYITLEGEDNSKTVMVGAHLDTLGLIVRKIEPDGTLRIRQLGGVSFQSVEGETVTVHTRSGRKYTGLLVCQSHSTHVFDDARTLERGENTMLISLDEKVETREDVLALGIRHGDIVSFEPHCTVTENGYVKSRFIDDKMAVAAVFAALKFMTENGLKPKYRTLLTFPFYEEINHGGAYIPAEVEEFVAIDIGLIGPDYDGNERAVSICVKDNFSPYDRNLVSRIITEAEANGINHAIDIFYRYGTDANAAVRAGNNVRAAAFGMACYCSHGMERTHLDGVVETAKLAVAYMMEWK
ncbi:MAG: M42 family metallopeptidase [Eubacteriales bacterium]|nr:M42 family metallopeptidase [Eubacteriales bacterium]